MAIGLINLRVITVAGLVVVGLAPSPVRADPAADIKAVQAAFIAAVKAKDLDAIMKFYAPDDSLVVFDIVPPRQYVGVAAVRKDWQDFLATVDGPLAVEMTDLVVEADDKLGFGHSIQHTTGKTKDGNPIDITLRVSDGYKKLGDRWVAVHEHVSVPIDLSTGTPDLQSKP